MNELAAMVFCILLGLAIVQSPLVLAFLRRLWDWRAGCNIETSCPKTAVVLCLRGGDPFLADTLRAVFELDYPDYEVHVVVDSQEDPAWEIVQQEVESRGARHVKVRVLADRRDTCGLKCSSLIQAISDLDDSYEVVAQLDADTVPHPRWLRELVAPLADERVGAATGNRWYMPAEPSWGALVRYLWNAAAVVQMYCYRIPWGGTMAIKTEVIRRCGLLDRWGNAFCEDTMLFGILRREGLRVAFVPSLMMVNREGADVSGFVRWMRRQLLTARLYHPRWPVVVGHGLIVAFVQLVAVGALLWALAGGHWKAAAWLGASLAVYLASLTLMLAPMEHAVRRIAAARQEPTGWFSGAVAVRMFPALLLTQVIYAAVLISAMFVRRVEWRGVAYEIRGPWDVRMVRCRPFQRVPENGESNTSL